MRILLTNLSLARLAGTETFTYELACKLTELGHQVQCFSPSLGIISEKLAMEGIACFDLLSKCQKPDIIHCHHSAGNVAHEYFLGVPTLAMHHGPTEPQEGMHFLADMHVAVSEEVAEALGIYHIVSNGVNLERFSDLHSADPECLIIPKSVYSWTMGLEREFDRAFIGVSHLSERSWNIEDVMQCYGYVAAIGRTAVEAAACGCRVLMWGPHGSDGFLTPENYHEVKKVNFSGRRWGNRTNIKEQLETIKDWDMRPLIEEYHDSRKMATQLVTLYKKCLDSQKMSAYKLIERPA